MLYLLDSQTAIEKLQFFGHFARDDGAVIADDQQDWDINGAYQAPIIRVGRRENLERD